MANDLSDNPISWLVIEGSSLTLASKLLIAYGAIMWLSCGLTWIISLNDPRTLREVGVWVKPMKFMAATALFAWTTVWVSHLANPAVTHDNAYVWICALIIVTSLFEVVYITYQGSRGEASHYNTSDPLHAMLFGVMALAAIGLTGSQAWLALELWKASQPGGLSVVGLSVVIGLLLTFILSTISGFLLGGNQPPAGQGLPIVGWHLTKDIRPSHFLGVHAQQLIPMVGLLCDRFLGGYAAQGVSAASAMYLMAWAVLTWASF